MNKTTTHKNSLDVCTDLPLEDHELDSVSGGSVKEMENQEQLKALETFGKALQKAGQI